MGKLFKYSLRNLVFLLVMRDGTFGHMFVTLSALPTTI